MIHHLYCILNYLIIPFLCAEITKFHVATATASSNRIECNFASNHTWRNRIKQHSWEIYTYICSANSPANPTKSAHSAPPYSANKYSISDHHNTQHTMALGRRRLPTAIYVVCCKQLVNTQHTDPYGRCASCRRGYNNNNIQVCYELRIMTPRLGLHCEKRLFANGKQQ